MENRKLCRINFEIEAQFSYKGKITKTQIKNISLKGALIEIIDELDIKLDENLDIKLIVKGLSTNLEISISTLIVRKDKNSLGLKFGTMDLDSFIHLRNIIAYNSGDYDMIMEEFTNNSLK